jgi:hypothetical protein
MNLQNKINNTLGIKPDYINPWDSLNTADLNIKFIDIDFAQFKLIKFDETFINEMLFFLKSNNKIILGVDLIIFDPERNKYSHDGASCYYNPNPNISHSENVNSSIDSFKILFTNVKNYSKNLNNLYLDFNIE